MTPDRLLQHFHRIVQAPNAIPRLRRFILDLAVRGKLVEQAPSDKPALKLLEQVFKDSAKVKKSNHTPFPPVAADEMAFSIPQSWVWTRTQFVTTYVQRGKSPKYTYEKKIPVVAQKCIQWHGFELEKAKFIEPLTISGYAKERFLLDGDLLWNSTGVGTLGRLIVFRNTFKGPYPRIVADSHVTVIRPSDAIDPHYLFIWFSGPIVQGEINDKASGTTKQTELSTHTILKYPIPLPPLAEQHRIVAKVNELMGVCDQLEAAQKERESRRDRLAAASLHRLSNGTKADTFHQDAGFHLSILPKITARPEHIRQIRQAILNLAVRGHLVPQDPNDEPASELLKRIRSEMEQLKQVGAIKSRKCLPLLSTDEAPFNVPSNWKWVRIRQVTTDRGQKVPSKDFSYIDVGAINKDAGLIGEIRVIAAAEAPSRARKIVKKGDVLYSCVRPYLLNVAILERDIEPAPIASTAFAIINGHGLIVPKYLWIALRSPFMVECVEEKMRGQAYPAINDSDFASLPLPLPPLPEQHRIVAKVEELMAVCDRLEAQIDTVQTESKRLLEAILHEALAG